MKNDSNLKMTELDYLTAAPHLQMVKAALPYIHIPEQRFFSLMVKISELERTIRLFDQNSGGEMGICSLEEGEPDSPIDMLNAMKPYGTEEEQDFIDLIINFMQGSRLYQSYRENTQEPESGFHQDEAAPPEQIRDSSHISEQQNTRNTSGHFPFEHLKNMLSPEQQSRFETAQMLMQTIQQFS